MLCKFVCVCAPSFYQDVEGMNETLYEQILDFLQLQTNCRPDELQPSTLVADHLGVDGDDASDLISKFAHKFDVDMSSYDWRDYFGAEGWDLLALFRRRKPLSIADLYHAASNHTWPEQTGRDSLI
jgi:acyl carrier protein